MMKYHFKAFFKELYNLASHKYIRTGETVILEDANCTWTATARVDDLWAVCVGGVSYIRRDLIKKNESGQWCYKYDY